MTRIIFKCNHIRNKNNKTKSHLQNIVNYISTRENVIKIEDENKLQTVSQEKFIKKYLSENVKNSFEYEDYIKNQTMKNAALVIERIIEENIEDIQNYIKYISNRPRVKKVENHGLFNETDEILNLKEVEEEIGSHKGVLWLPIISLKREDAEKLGYDKIEAWKNLIKSKQIEMAKAMKIPVDKFRWYAAFHDESHHPHIHMIVYSEDEKSGFLTEKGIEKIKGMLANEIFKNKLYEIYNKQTDERNKLKDESLNFIRNCIENINLKNFSNKKLEILTQQLYKELKNTKGKKVYGYLKAEVKNIVDEIVDEIAKEDSIEKCYESWWEFRKEILKIYSNNDCEIPKLSSQKEFKNIKNIVIKEILNLDEIIEEQKAIEYYENEFYKDEEVIFQEEVPTSFYESYYQLEYEKTEEEKAIEYYENEFYRNKKEAFQSRYESLFYEMQMLEYEKIEQQKGIEYYEENILEFKKYDEYEINPNTKEFIKNKNINNNITENAIKNIALNLLKIFENSINQDFKNKSNLKVDRKRLRKIKEKKILQGHNTNDGIDFIKGGV